MATRKQLVVLRHRADVAEVATELGAAAGLRKPLNVGELIATVRRTLPTPEADFPEEPTPQRMTACSGRTPGRRRG